MGRILTCGVIVFGFLTVTLVIGGWFTMNAVRDLSVLDHIHEPWDRPRGTSVHIETEDPVKHGEALYWRNCSGCHAIDGSERVGPPLDGLFGSEVRLESGIDVRVDEDYIRVKITDPDRTTRSGYRDSMPRFDRFDREEIDSLVAFIRSLR